MAEGDRQVDRHVVNDAISLRIFPQHNGEMMVNWPEFKSLAVKKKHIAIDLRIHFFFLATELVSPHGKKKDLFEVN